MSFMIQQYIEKPAPQPSPKEVSALALPPISLPDGSQIVGWYVVDDGSSEVSMSGESFSAKYDPKP